MTWPVTTNNGDNRSWFPTTPPPPQWKKILKKNFVEKIICWKNFFFFFLLKKFSRKIFFFLILIYPGIGYIPHHLCIINNSNHSDICQMHSKVSLTRCCAGECETVWVPSSQSPFELKWDLAHWWTVSHTSMDWPWTRVAKYRVKN